MVRVLKPNGRIALSDLQEHSFEALRSEHADLWLGFDMKDVARMMRESGIGKLTVEALGSCCSTSEASESIQIPIFLAAGVKGHAIQSELKNELSGP